MMHERTSSETLLPEERSLVDKDSGSDKHCATCHCAHRGTHLVLRRSVVYWAIGLCILCTLVNFAAILSLSLEPSSPHTIHPDDYHTLRRPSPFVGLDKIDRSSFNVPPRHIINYPQLVAQVDSQNPSMVFDPDPLRYMTHTGNVSPEEKRVKVTQSISTIAQFRVIDFGMELCEVKLRFHTNTSHSSSTEPSMLSLYRLDSVTPLNARSLSHKTRPERTTKLGNFIVSPTEAVFDWSRNLTCHWDQVLTFELACTSDRDGYRGTDCGFEWWQDKKSEDPSMAIYMIQHSTA